MPDHIHVLLTPTESTAKAVQLIKGGFSFAIREQFQGEVWHTGHHEHRIRDEADYAAQLAYIAKNPTRKTTQTIPTSTPTTQTSSSRPPSSAKQAATLPVAPAAP